MRPLSLDRDPEALDPAVAGAKAAALARARRAGLPALPGLVLPAAAARPSLREGVRALRERAGDSGAARRGALRVPLGDALEARLNAVVEGLGGRVIVRSSSPLEGDNRWSGAFSSVGEVTPGDIGVAVRSCWSSVFAVDPLERLEHCGLDPGDLELAVLIQPEVTPDSGGLARIVPASRDAGARVRITGVRGHPGGLLSGWDEGATAECLPGGVPEGELPALVGGATAVRVAELARAVHAALGDDTIEWAATGPEVHLLQTARTATPSRPSRRPAAETSRSGHVPGQRITGRTCVAGDAVGRLHYVRPHRPVPPGAPHILVCDRPRPALAPLLFGARGVVALGGPEDSHLAEVARSIGVPMLVLREPLERAVGPVARLNEGDGWLGTIDAARSELAVVARRPGEEGGTGP